MTDQTHFNGIIMLVGLMGCGKSSVGRRLSSHYNLPFIDGDSEVEAAAGCTVAEIFDYYGEDIFRDGERRVMKRLLEGPPCILASGGGAYINEQTRALAKQNALTVWLKADIDVLYNRTRGRSHRPLLNGDGLYEKLENFIKTRYPVYAEADIMVTTKDEPTKKTVARVVEAIDNFVKNKQNQE